MIVNKMIAVYRFHAIFQSCALILWHVTFLHAQASLQYKTHTVYLVSNRRSGTHMTMNAIRNRYENVRVCKTNHITPFDVSCGCIAWMQKSGTIVHAKRDLAGMVQSQFYYLKQFKNKYGISDQTTIQQYAKMDEVINELVQIWYNTIQWMYLPNVTTVFFDEIARQNYTSLDAIGFKKRAKMQIYGFDPTPKAINYVQKHKIQNFHFTPSGLSNYKGVATFTKPLNPNFVSMKQGSFENGGQKIMVRVNTLQNWMRALGHSHIEILKIDIEGSEYAVIQHFFENCAF